MNELLLTLTCLLAIMLAYGTVFYVFERRMHRVYRDGYRELQESYDRSDVIFREAMDGWGKSIQMNRDLLRAAAGTEENQP